jgi:bacterioferritin
MPATKVSKEFLDMLNKAISMELQVAIQYMWQHVQWSGVQAFTVKDSFKSAAIDEMKHAEMIAERLFYLGGIPTTAPAPINVGKELKEMLIQNEKDERGAIEFYKKIVAKANAEGDEVDSRMFRQILQDEEDHHDTFESLLEGM